MALQTASVLPSGLEGDRNWLVIDDSGRFVSQRTVPAMATVDACLVEGGLVLSAVGHGAVAVQTPAADAPVVVASIWRDRVPARLADGAAGRWLSQLLGVSCRLVHQHDLSARPTDPAYAPGGTVSFADGYPVLATSDASLSDLNERLLHPVGMDRFRTNLVVSGFPAWAEDDWHSLRVGAVRFRAVKPCARCVVTTVDQRTGKRPDRVEPLATLARFRGHGSGEVLFGQNFIPVEEGVVSVGDAVEVT